MANEMKTIKIPEQEFERVKEARTLLAMEGINKLEPNTIALIKKNVENFDKLTMGIIIGIGATLLIQELSR